MTRSNARELAIHLIYAKAYTDQSAEALVEDRLKADYYCKLAEENDIYAERPSKKQRMYIDEVVEGVGSHEDELNEYIKKYAVGWHIDRISRLAKAAMQLAIFESLYREDVPVGVAVNEAVQFVKKYEDEDVVSFVNGILRGFSRSLENENGTDET